MTKILIVDDSPTMRRMVMTALQPFNATFAEAGNGLEAIEQLALAQFDAVTLDLNLPDMRGVDIIQHVRKQAATQALPILVVSAVPDDDSRRLALNAGADGFVVKIDMLDQLPALLQKLLPGQESANI